MTKRKSSPRGERRYVIVTDRRDGMEYRVLTSVAAAGYALIQVTPSNEHRAGQLAGMLMTHGQRTKGLVFNDIHEAAAYVGAGRRLEASQRLPADDCTRYHPALVRELTNEENSK